MNLEQRLRTVEKALAPPSDIASVMVYFKGAGPEVAELKGQGGRGFALIVPESRRDGFPPNVMFLYRRERPAPEPPANLDDRRGRPVRRGNGRLTPEQEAEVREAVRARLSPEQRRIVDAARNVVVFS